MYRNLPNCRVLFFLLFLFILSTSFNEKLDKTTCDFPTVSKSGDTGYSKYYSPDDLYILEITADLFKEKNTDKWVFKFIHAREETLTLHGWTANGWFGRKFDTKHEIELTPTVPSGVKYDANMYFGDIVLSRKSVRRIKKRIKNEKVSIVRFTPNPKEFPHVSYIVSLIRTESDNKETTLQTTYNANPSPPKGFTNSVSGN